MTRLLIILMLCAGAGAAQAEEPDRSLLQCGVQLGGTDLAYKPASAIRRQGVKFRAQFAANSHPVHAPQESRFKFNFKKDNTVSSRLPAIMAIARVGCAWR